MISTLVILSDVGDVLIKEDYRTDILQEDLEHLLQSAKEINSPPVINYHDVHGYFIRRDKLVYLAVSQHKLQEFFVLHFLESFHATVRNFCGAPNEDSIRKNLVLVHELMCECIENGNIHVTSTEQLRSVVYSDPVTAKPKMRKPGLFGLEVQENSPALLASGPLVRSRSQQMIKHDEVFVDVIEKLNVHFGKHGAISHFHLNGCIQLKSFIPHTHTVRISFNRELFSQKGKNDAYMPHLQIDKYHFDDCVNTDQFLNKFIIVVNPPQAEVSVMQYHISSSIPSQMPFLLTSSLKESNSSNDCDLTLKLSCDLPENSRALNVIVHIPISSATRNVMQQFSIAECSAKFIDSEKKILWKIKSLAGNSEIIGKFKLVDALQCSANKLEMGPVALEFEISNHVVSGLVVKNLKAEITPGKSVAMQKWLRYITLANSYMFKI